MSDKIQNLLKKASLGDEEIYETLSRELIREGYGLNFLKENEDFCTLRHKTQEGIYGSPTATSIRTRQLLKSGTFYSYKKMLGRIKNLPLAERMKFYEDWEIISVICVSRDKESRAELAGDLKEVEKAIKKHKRFKLQAAKREKERLLKQIEEMETELQGELNE